MISWLKNSKKILSIVAVTGAIIGSVPFLALAQSNPGVTLFGGVERENILNYYLDFGGNSKSWDRYRLRIPGNKLTEGVAKLYVVYPDYFDGKFDTEEIQVRLNNKPLPLREVIWDQESRVIEIDLENPLLESRNIEIVMSNVYNPSSGTFYLQGQMMTAGQIPLRLSLGTWIVSIN